jgi:aminoglycoside phosphotransferase (APT) family kinase protein
MRSVRFLPSARRHMGSPVEFVLLVVMEEASPIVELEQFVDLASLERRIGASIVGVCALREGKVNKSFRLCTSKQDFVVKFFRDLSHIHSRLSPEARAATEYTTMNLCGANNLCSPRGIALLGSAVVMTYVGGSNIACVPLDRSHAAALAQWLYDFHRAAVPQDCKALGPLNTPLVGCAYYLDNFPDNGCEATVISDIKSLYLQIPQVSMDSVVALRGDPTLRNWILPNGGVCGFDFEFASMGHPAFDLGILCASILDHGAFGWAAFELASAAFLHYNALCREHNTYRVSTQNLAFGIVTAFVLMAATVQCLSRRDRLLGKIPTCLGWAKQL